MMLIHFIKTDLKISKRYSARPKFEKILFLDLKIFHHLILLLCGGFLISKLSLSDPKALPCSGKPLSICYVYTTLESSIKGTPILFRKLPHTSENFSKSEIFCVLMKLSPRSCEFLQITCLH